MPSQAVPCAMPRAARPLSPARTDARVDEGDKIACRSTALVSLALCRPDRDPHQRGVAAHTEPVRQPSLCVGVNSRNDHPVTACPLGRGGAAGRGGRKTEQREPSGRERADLSPVWSVSHSVATVAAPMAQAATSKQGLAAGGRDRHPCYKATSAPLTPWQTWPRFSRTQVVLVYSAHTTAGPASTRAVVWHTA